MAFTNVASQEVTFSQYCGDANPISSDLAIPDLAANSVGYLAIMCHGVSGTVTLNAVTWGGSAMTKIVPASNTLSATSAHEYYIINPPDNGTKTISITFSNGTPIVTNGHIVVAYVDAEAAVTLDDSSEETGTTQNPDIVSTQAGADELVISASVSTANAVGSPTTTDCTELQNYDSGGNCSIAAYSIPGSSGDVTHQHNYSQNGTYAIVSASFKETSSGYTLTAAQGSYSLTGQAAGVKAARKLAAGQGSYTLTGQAAGVLHGRKLTAAQGSYSLTGQAAGLKIARRLVAESGSYTLTGQAAGLRAARKITAAQGSYSLTGQAAGLLVSRLLTAAQGSYSLSGIDATLTYSGGGLTHYTLTAAHGSYSLIGQAAGLRVSRKMTAGQGSYSLTGQAAGLLVSRLLTAAQGSYSLSGQAAGLLVDRVLAAGQGSYTLTGQAAGLLVARLLTAEQGSYTLTGVDVTLTYAGSGLTHYTLTAENGSYILTGYAANLVLTRIIPGGSLSAIAVGRRTLEPAVQSYKYRRLR